MEGLGCVCSTPPSLLRHWALPTLCLVSKELVPGIGEGSPVSLIAEKNLNTRSEGRAESVGEPIADQLPAWVRQPGAEAAPPRNFSGCP